MSTLRILQIADVHLDCAFSGVLDQNVRDRLRWQQRDVFRAALAHARDADLVLIPGDLYEQNSSPLDTVRFVQKELQEISPVPVFIAPGNHDPCVRGSYYLTTEWPQNVRVFTNPHFESRSLSDGSATIFGIANSGDRDTHCPFDSFAAEGPGLKIGLLHGTCADSLPPGFAEVQCLPFASEDLTRAGLDYVALGHFHSRREFAVAGRLIACYSGCLQSTAFDEQGEKGLLKVTIDGDHTSVEFVRSDCTPFCTYDLELGTVDNSMQVVDELRSLADREELSDSIVRVRLCGEIDPAIDIRLDDVQGQASDFFKYLTVDGSKLRIGYDFESLSKQDSIAGRLVRKVDESVANLRPDASERLRLERARLYALDALFGREVRWP